MPPMRNCLVVALAVLGVAAAGAPAAEATSIVSPQTASPGHHAGEAEILRPRERGYHHGYRGYRQQRPGYRYHEGYWFPPEAFAAGTGSGRALPVRPPHAAGRSHQAWCESRYRTYRASDNTYVGNAGIRRPCVSPSR